MDDHWWEDYFDYPERVSGQEVGRFLADLASGRFSEQQLEEAHAQVTENRMARDERERDLIHEAQECPSCGRLPRFTEVPPEMFDMFEKWHVACSCGLSGPVFSTPTQGKSARKRAVDAWNGIRRA